eukprot:1161672-Pelagomonas_calceolata.AAC.5
MTEILYPTNQWWVTRYGDLVVRNRVYAAARFWHASRNWQVRHPSGSFGTLAAERNPYLKPAPHGTPMQGACKKHLFSGLKEPPLNIFQASLPY